MERGMSEEDIGVIVTFSKVFPGKSAKEITEDLNKIGMRVTEEYVKEAWRLEGESVVKDLSLEEELEREFDMEYKDPNGAAKYVVDYIDLCFDTWKARSSTWYAPCTAIVQSSGWGKSRLIKEIALAPEMPVVFYFSLMKPAHKGYPKTDPDLYKLLRSITSFEEGYALITACFDWYSNSRGRLGKEEIYKRHQRKEYGEVIECMKERGVSLGNKEKNQCNCTEDAMNSAGQKAMADLQKDGFGRKGVCFLFVFDEARNLLESPFYCIRRAFKKLVSNVKAFLMFIDTKKLPNLTPASDADAGADRSSRVATCLNKLFPPLCRLPTFDVVSFDAASSTQKQGLEDIFSPESLYRQGRPLWYARHKLNLQELLDLALQKLMGGVSPDTSEGKSFLEENPIAPVALLGRRIAVDVCPQSRMSEEIVASHMGVCLHVSASREHVLSATLPEPVLSEAVAMFYRECRNYLEKHLSKLNGQLLNGMVTAGERGELIARFLILEAMDALQKEAGKDSTTPVKLEHLLAKLFRNFQPGNFPDLRELLDAEIFFNAFHRFHGKPSRNDIHTFLRKCAAMICERNQKSFDLYIPYVLPSKGVADNLLEDRIGCVGIQIKNWKNIAKIKPTTMHMKKHRDDIKNYGDGEVAPGLLILMHMSSEKKKTGKPIGCQVCNETLVVRGLDDLIIEDDVKVAVDDLLLDTPDPLKVLELEVKEDMSNSRAYLPLFTRKAIDREMQALKDILRSVRNDPVPGADTSVPSAKRRKL